jgi:hypothetical protein
MYFCIIIWRTWHTSPFAIFSPFRADYVPSVAMQEQRSESKRHKIIWDPDFFNGQELKVINSKSY